MSSQDEIIDKLKNFIDDLEDLYGPLEGFSVKLEHPIVDGERQEYADIREFNIEHITITPIIKDNEKV